MLAIPIALAAEEGASSYTLRELQLAARAAHPTLASAEAAVEAAAAALRQARAYPNPQIAVGLGRGRPRDGGDSRSERTVELVQPLELAGLRRWRARAAELRLQAAEIDRDLAATLLDATLARLVYTTLLDERRVEIARESVAIAASLHALLERRVALGESAPLEALRARSEWFARRREVLEAERQLESARSALRGVCGAGPASEIRLAERLEDPGPPPPALDLVERLRAENPLLRRARQALEEARAETEVASREAFPGLDLRAAHETELDREATHLGLALTIPLWSRNRGAIARRRAESSRADAELRALTRELESALDQASATYRGALAAVRLHEEGWTECARTSLDIAGFSFENGEASLLDLLDAQRAYLGVRLTEAESRAGLAVVRAEIERLIGGPLGTEAIHE
jgi:cobalt-zinc-cadmium efflux system outer membrane protein